MIVDNSYNKLQSRKRARTYTLCQSSTIRECKNFDQDPRKSCNSNDQNLQSIVDNLFIVFKQQQCENIKSLSKAPNKSLIESVSPLQQNTIRIKKQAVQFNTVLRLRKPLVRNSIDSIDSSSDKKRELELQQLLKKLDCQQSKVEVCEKNERERPKSSTHQKQQKLIKRPQVIKIPSLSIENTPFTSLKQERYQVLDQLGAGAYAKVSKARDTFTDAIVAIKTYMRNINSIWRDAPLKEAKWLKKLCHPNIIKLLAVTKTITSINLVIEYFGRQTLYSLLRDQPKNRLSELEFRDIFSQLAEAVAYCHSQGIVHRDIKIENTLVNGKRVKLIDFGLASESGNLIIQCGTPSYMSPEMCQRRSTYRGEKADVWALGVVFYVSLVGKFPFEGSDDLQLFKGIVKNKIKVPRFLSSNAQILLLQMLEKDPAKRISSSDVLSSNFLSA